jgi:hypothetical protein
MRVRSPTPDAAAFVSFEHRPALIVFCVVIAILVLKVVGA